MKEKDRSRQWERSSYKHGTPVQQEAQAGQSIVTGSSFTKNRMHRLRPRTGGEVLAYYDSIYHDQELNHWAKAVYVYLKDHANKKGTY